MLGIGLAALLLVACGSAGVAPHPRPQPTAVAEPGFRPQSDHSEAFTRRIANADVVVFPTIVRSLTDTTYSVTSARSTIRFLAVNQLGSARSGDARFDLGGLNYLPQWTIFQQGLERIAAQMRQHAVAADYALVTEILIPPNDPAMFVFGINVYILEPDGTNVFSFVLNSHHELFADAGLRVSASDAKGKQWLIRQSTDVALAALAQQVARARSALGIGHGAVAAPAEYALNELPMYGNGDKTPAQLEADRQFIEEVTPRLGGRAAASEHFARTGWNLFYLGDRRQAIRRFNQSWLLDPGNAHALWGFAVTTLERGETASALRFYEMAIERWPENRTLQMEYETVRRIREASSIDPP